MTLHEKTESKRYCVDAKRVDGKSWTDWMQTDDLDIATEQIEKIRSLGFLGKITDRKEHKIILVIEGE